MEIVDQTSIDIVMACLRDRLSKIPWLSIAARPSDNVVYLGHMGRKIFSACDPDMLDKIVKFLEWKFRR